MYCETGCKQCTELECTMCIEADLLPIKGTCLYSSDCNISNCKFCGGVLYSTCLQCMDGYLQTGVDGACERQSVKNPKGIYIVVFAAIAIVGILIIIVVIAIRITKRIKNNAEMSERVRLLAASQDRTPTTDPATPSRTFYTPTATFRDSGHEPTEQS